MVIENGAARSKETMVRMDETVEENYPGVFIFTEIPN